MSLPQANKDVATHPSSNAVVDPVDKKAQAADVDRKLRLFGVIQAFRKGRLPSNKQIDETLNFVLTHSPVTTEQLSSEGKRLIQDVRHIITTAKLMVQEKNADELFQNFVWHTQGATRETDGIKLKDVITEATSASSVDSDKARQDGENALRHLRTLLTLVLTNSEVRKLLTDFSLIGRDLLSIGAAKAAKSLSPDPDRLATVDESAPNDQFITEGGRVAGPHETPVFEGTVPFTGKKIRHHPKDDTAFVQNRDQFGAQGRPIGEVAREGQGMYESAKHEGFRAGDEVLGEASRHAQEFKEMDERGDEQGKEAKKNGFVGKMQQVRDNVRDGFNERIPQQHKDRAHDNFDRSKKFFTEEYFPEERRDQFIFRGKKVILECQKHDNYQDSMRWLLSYVEEYVKHGRAISQTTSERAKDSVPADKAHPIKLATLELRTLLERFANNTSMGPIYNAMDVLIDHSRHDEGLLDWFKSADNWLRKVLLQPGYILEPDCDNQGKALRSSGHHYYDDKYKAQFDDLFNNIGDWFKAMGEDPLNKRFGDDWARLTKDLLFDSEGHLKFKSDLWNDVRRVVLPQLIQKIGYLPIPRIEYTDDSLDLVVENLTLQGRNLFPNVVALDVHNYVKFSPYDAISDESNHHISFTLQQIQADMRDVAFYYRKKTGIPKMKDSGIADVLIGGEGVSAHVTLASTTRDRSSVFHVQDITVKVDNLKFSIRESKHDFLYKTLRPIATGLIKKQIQKAIRDGLRTGLEYVDGQLVGVRDRMESAKESEEGSRVDVLKDLFHSSKSTAEDANARTDIQAERGAVGGTVRSTASTRSNSSAATKESHFKIVSDKRNSLLGDIGNPAGWVNRSAERNNVVDKTTAAVVGNGEVGWKSDAFTITPTNPATATMRSTARN